MPQNSRQALWCVSAEINGSQHRPPAFAEPLRNLYQIARYRPVQRRVSLPVKYIWIHQHSPSIMRFYVLYCSIRESHPSITRLVAVRTEAAWHGLMSISVGSRPKWPLLAGCYGLVMLAVTVSDRLDHRRFALSK